MTESAGKDDGRRGRERRGRERLVLEGGEGRRVTGRRRQGKARKRGRARGRYEQMA